MKAKLILFNLILSFLGLSIDTDHSPMWAVILMVIWFSASVLLLKYADRKGWMDEVVKRYKMDEL